MTFASRGCVTICRPTPGDEVGDSRSWRFCAPVIEFPRRTLAMIWSAILIRPVRRPVGGDRPTGITVPPGTGLARCQGEVEVD